MNLNDGDASPNNKINQFANNFNWQYDKNQNRLTQETRLPDVKDCHKATVDYIPTLRNRRNTSKSVNIDPLPKVFGEKKMS